MISLDSALSDMTGSLPALEDIVADICMPGRAEEPASVDVMRRDLSVDSGRRAWNPDGIEPRCDFADHRSKMVFRSRQFGCMTLWQRSIYGQTLRQIKEDEENIGRFALECAGMIRRVIGSNLAHGGWAMTVPPPRRHRERNFASLTGERLAAELEIPFCRQIADAPNRRRVGTVYSLHGEPPSEPNIIVFDDIITTGSTLGSMHALLSPLGYNLFFFAAINNKA